MAGIVYHANYLRYIERARSDWVRQMGIDQLAMKDAGQVFAVRRIEAEYRRPARFDDLLVVETWVETLTPARMVMGQIVRREDTEIFGARVTVAVIGPGGKPARLPAELRALPVAPPP